MRFKDKVALITAAANGIGRATADDHGARRRDGDRRRQSPGPARRGGAGAAQAGGKAGGRSAQAVDAPRWTRSSPGRRSEHGRIDILVNAVGGSTVIAKPRATTEELTFADWQKLIAFNLDGTFLFTHAVISGDEAAASSGKIVNLASIAGRGLSANSSSAYAAAKGGIIAFTRKLAHELGPDGINVNAIAPSLTLTERIRPHWEKRSQGLRPKRSNARRCAASPKRPTRPT